MKYFLIFLLLNICKNVEVGEIIQLPEPKREGGMGIYEAFSKRQSLRNFDGTAKISLETLSQALWVCYGIREGVYRTVPSAKAWYPFIIYVFLESGVYKYNPVGHALIKLKDGDHRVKSGTQKTLVSKAAANFVLFGDLNKEIRVYKDKSIKREIIGVDVGHVTMALSLFAAANNMKGVVRGEVDIAGLLEFLNLNPEDYKFGLAFSLGY